MQSTSTDATTIAPGQVVLFRDPHPDSPAREGFNQTGVLLPHGHCVFIRAGRSVEMTWSEMVKLDAVLLRIRVEGLEEKVAAFFQHNSRRPKLVAAGLRALEAQTYGVFDDVDRMPVFHGIPTEAQYQPAWERLVSRAQLGDLILVYDHRSIIDRIIARLDYGAWSHAAVYVGDGLIVESVPGKGVIQGSIEVYRDRHVRLGVYRDATLSREEVQRGVTALLRTVGRPYGYRGALRLGLAKFILRIVRGDTAEWVSAGHTPNDMVYGTGLTMVGWV